MLSSKDLLKKMHSQTEGENLQKTYHSCCLQKQAGVSILISYKLFFKPKLIKRDKEGHFILLKRLIQEEIAVMNTYALIGADTYIKQTILNDKNQIGQNTIILGNVSIPLSTLDR